MRSPPRRLISSEKPDTLRAPRGCTASVTLDDDEIHLHCRGYPWTRNFGIAHELCLPQVALDRQHITAISAHHAPLPRHLVDGQLGAEVAAETLHRPRHRERLAGDHSPLHDRHPKPVDVDRRGGEEQAGEKPDGERPEDRPLREGPL
jgi:hypothetical protein